MQTQWHLAAPTVSMTLLAVMAGCHTPAISPQSVPSTAASATIAPPTAPAPPPSYKEDFNYNALYSAYHRPSLPFRLVRAGGTSLGFQVYRSEADLIAGAGSGSPPIGPPLPVDFAQETLVVIRMQSGTNWSRSEVAGVEEQPEGLLVQVVQWEDLPVSPRPAVEGYISAAIAIPRTSKSVLLAPLLTGYYSQRTAIFAEAPTPPFPSAQPNGETFKPIPGPLRPSVAPSPNP
jgi:hypothetical protein